METIFDHSPTKEELRAHFGRVVTREEHLSVPRDQVTEYALIYSLHRMRGNTAMVEKYRAMIPADYLRNCVELNDLVPA